MFMLGAKSFKSSAINILLCDYRSSARRKDRMIEISQYQVLYHFNSKKVLSISSY